MPLCDSRQTFFKENFESRKDKVQIDGLSYEGNCIARVDHPTEHVPTRRAEQFLMARAPWHKMKVKYYQDF